MGQLNVTSVPWVRELTAEEKLRVRQSYCAARWFAWDYGAPPLASLHANPAHSALRRVRCFEEAGRSAVRALKRYTQPRNWDFDDYCFEFEDALAGAVDGYADAVRRTLWSVR